MCGGEFKESEEKKGIKVLDEEEGIYKKMVVRGNEIVGGVLLGERREGRGVEKM